MKAKNRWNSVLLKYKQKKEIVSDKNEDLLSFQSRISQFNNNEKEIKKDEEIIAKINSPKVGSDYIDNVNNSVSQLKKVYDLKISNFHPKYSLKSTLELLIENLSKKRILEKNEREKERLHNLEKLKVVVEKRKIEKENIIERNMFMNLMEDKVSFKREGYPNVSSQTQHTNFKNFDMEELSINDRENDLKDLIKNERDSNINSYNEDEDLINVLMLFLFLFMFFIFV
jgi:hypothetical protein